MRRLFFLLMLSPLIVGCSVFEVTASFKFVNEENLFTRASLSDDHVFAWENGDELNLSLSLYRKDGPELLAEGGSIPVPVKTVEAKLVYSDGEWVIYKYAGKECIKVDVLSVSMPSSNYYVTIDYRYSEPMVLEAHWHITVEFREGLQEIGVTNNPFGIN